MSYVMLSHHVDMIIPKCFFSIFFQMHVLIYVSSIYNFIPYLLEQIACNISNNNGMFYIFASALCHQFIFFNSMWYFIQVNRKYIYVPYMPKQAY